MTGLRAGGIGILAGVMMMAGCGRDNTPKVAHVTTLPRMAAMTEPATQDSGLVEGFMKLPADAGVEKVVEGKTYRALPSGVMYRDLKAGEGAGAKVGQAVAVRYTVRHMDEGKPGDVFETNEGPGGEARRWTLGVPEVILPGWQEGIAGMKKGGRREVIVPPEMAYGKTGVLPNVKPNETLLFEFELESVTGDPHEFGKKPVASGPSTMIGPTTEVAGGLKVEELKVGEGALAAVGKRVRVHYTGWLTNGTKFDSSRDRKDPFKFTLGASEVIKGWDEGVAGMKVGGMRRLTVPPALGYRGEDKRDGRGQVIIPANSTLIFEVELLGVE